MGWNYRLVRKKHEWTDAKGETRIDYTYGIHEAFYDKLGKVVMITEDAMEPFGETAKDCRHSWVMMGEAFGKPILDYNQIPEPGHDTEDSLANVDKLKEELEEAVATKDDEDSKEINNWINDFDREAFEKEQEAERVASEVEHTDKFGNYEVYEELISAIFKDYLDHRQKQKEQDAIYQASRQNEV